MSSRPERELLNDILEAIRRASLYVTEMNYEQFMTDTKTQDAVIRNLEIVGEATKRLPLEIRIKHPAIPWQIVTEELPNIATQVELLLTEQAN